MKVRKYRCDCRGQLSPSSMCGNIIVRSGDCAAGDSDYCEHKVRKVEGKVR